LFEALRRASVAAGLVLDDERFGFPDSHSIAQALRAGIVE